MTNKDSTNIKYKFISGGISGVVEVICTHPIDLVKTKLQEASQKNIVIKNPIQYFYSKYRFYGLQYLYTGFIPRIIGIIPMRLVFWGVQGTSNEYLKKYNLMLLQTVYFGKVLNQTRKILCFLIYYMNHFLMSFVLF